MRRFWRRLAASAVLMAMAMLAAPGAASPGEPRSGWPPVCWSNLPAAVPAVEAVRQGDWRCRMRPSALQGDRVGVRFTATDAAGNPVRYLQGGLGPFGALTLIAVDRDGSMASRRLGQNDTVPVLGQPSFAAAFPTVARPEAFYAVIDRMGSGYVVKAMKTSTDPPGATWGDRAATVLMALLIGMLLIPALVDLAIFHALRNRFFLYHALLTFAVAALLSTWSGLVLEFVHLTMTQWYRHLMLAIGLAAAAACVFNRAIALAGGAGKLPARALLVAAWYSLAVTGLFLTGALDPMVVPGMFGYAFVPVLVLLCGTLVLRFRHGDAAERLQVMGWVPLLLFFFAQLAADVLGLRLPANGMPLLFLGALIETVVSAIGVGMQFLAVRRERDTAMVRANVMGDLAERDPLTGLLNRRAIDTRFEDLRARGYDTVALIDLDHFKTINDVSGHGVGDQVLEITARVLASDPDNIAVRLGGEEFLVLLRGTDPSARAEKLRRMLSVRVAREVDGLEQIVTASMGLLTLPTDGAGTLSFSSAYSRADLLLYEAKRDGRNRTKAAHWGLFDGAAVEAALAAGQDIRDRTPVTATAA